MTPNVGQGANTAIESAAALANVLKKTIDLRPGSSPSNIDIGNALESFVKRRMSRVKKLFSKSKFLVRLMARDDKIKLILGRYIVPYLGDFPAKTAGGAIAGGEVLDFLPSPQRSKERPTIVWRFLQPDTFTKYRNTGSHLMKVTIFLIVAVGSARLFTI